MKPSTLLAIAISVLLAGCHTPRSSDTVWEYRFYDKHGLSAIDEGLNRLATEGWVVQSFTTTPDYYYTFLLKRPKK